MSRYEIEKMAALDKIAGGAPIRKSSIGKGMYYVGDDLVHVRYNSRDPNHRFQYWYSIYSSSLSADFEVWILGDTGIFFTIPRCIIQRMYEDPDAYLDRGKDEKVVVVTINIEDESHAAFSRKAEKVYIECYFQSTIEQVRRFCLKGKNNDQN